MTHPDGVSLGRRFAAITLDWLTSYVIAAAFLGNPQLTTLLVFIGQYAILVSLTGASFGHRLMKLKVVNYSDGGRVSPIQAMIRTVLIALVITAITYDEEGRGIHERFSRTVLKKS
jgi:uncharacterized RDD family membrane protein YckC